MRIRPRHPALFLVALLAAYLLWYSLAGQRREATAVRGFKVPLTLVNMPQYLVITSNVPETVALQLRGPLSVALESRMALEVLLDLSDARPGLFTLPIDENDLQLPPQVSLVSVEPAAITLELERMETVSLPVEPVIEGAPAPGYVLGSVRVAPAQLTVKGPGSLLTALERVETSPLSVEGATSQIEATVRPSLPHPLLKSLTVVPLLVLVDVRPEPAPTSTPTRRSRGGRQGG